MVLRRSSGAAENAALASGEYRSALFERFTGVLSRIGPEAAVLDLGPTTPSNITFWTQRGHRVSAVGLAARLERGSGLDLGEIEYGGIVCWNVLTLLSRERARQVVADLRSVLVPGGAIFAIFDGDGRAEPPSLRYRITPGFRIDGMAAAASSRINAGNRRLL